VGITTKQGTIESLEGTSHEDIFLADHVLAAQNTSLTAHIVSRVRLSEKESRGSQTTFMLHSGTLSVSVSARPRSGPARERAMQQGF